MTTNKIKSCVFFYSEPYILGFQIKTSHFSDRKNIFIQELSKIKSNIIVLAQNREFCKRLILLSFAWFSVGCGSYGMHFSIKLVNFDVFVVTVIKEIVVGTTILMLIPLYKKVKHLSFFLSFFLAANKTNTNTYIWKSVNQLKRLITLLKFSKLKWKTDY